MCAQSACVCSVALAATLVYTAGRNAAIFKKAQGTFPKLSEIPRVEVVAVGLAFVAWSIAIPGSALYSVLGALWATLSIPLGGLIVWAISPLLY